MKVMHLGWGFRPWRVGGLIAYAEDLMTSQAASGHQVSYFFQGRHYPLPRRPRLKRWHRDGVAMYELQNAPQLHGGDRGSIHPELDLHDPITESAFATVLDEVRPDVVHIQELGGMPSVLIEMARARGVPTVMSLEDYAPLCPTVKLFDVDGMNCKRLLPGEQCVRCCAQAPVDDRHLLLQTALYHGVPGGARGLARFGDVVSRLRRRSELARSALSRVHRETAPRADGPPQSRSPAPPAAYDRRRELNVARLSAVDLVLAMSTRVEQIYRELGVKPKRMRTLQFTLRHLEELRPNGRVESGRPLRLVTLNGCASEEKGARVVVEAVELLAERGLAKDVRLDVLGSVGPAYAPLLSSHKNVVIRGHYTPEELGSLLDEFDVGIVPSVWEEAYGYTGVELLAKGLPVVGNRLGGLPDYVVQGETGWLTDEPSGAGLARVVERLVADPDHVMELRRNLRRRRDVLIKPMDVHLREIEEAYAEVVNPVTAAAGT
jgi:glycosyltransferase involved in cell wall biosynthesis